MASTSTLSLESLIEETLSILYRINERPRQVILGSDDLSNASDTLFTLLADAEHVNVSDVLEFGQELILVTAKSADASPVFTGSRGYNGTAKNSSVTTGTVGLLNPEHPRYEVRRTLLRAFKGPFNTWLPSIVGEAVTRDAGKQYATLPATTLKVLRLSHLDPTTGRFIDLDQWEFVDDLPTSVVSTGKLLRLPSYLSDTDEVIVLRQVPYAWSEVDPTEEATIEVPVTAEDLPVLYAVAVLVTGREVTRLELDKVEERINESTVRNDANVRLIREYWGQFYRRLDEARRVTPVPKHRPYRKMRKA